MTEAMTEAMIEVKDLSKTYGPVRALNGVSFAVPRGQVVGLLGPNGAGKTTAMRILTGYVAPTEGTALVDGEDVIEEPMACRSRIGYLPEGNPLYQELRVSEALAFAARVHGLDRARRPSAIAASVETAGLAGLEPRIVGTLSKGLRQRVGLAQALMHDPDILILDEPTSGLDPNQQEEMRRLIRSLGAEHTVILSTHILSEVEAVCDRALIINQGNLAADGSVDEIRRQVVGGAAARLVVRGAEEAARTAFAAIEHAGSVEVEALAGEEDVLLVRVALSETPTRQLLERLAAAAHESGLGLSSLAAETASLEQVFAALTMDEAQDAAPPTTPSEES